MIEDQGSGGPLNGSNAGFFCLASSGGFPPYESAEEFPQKDTHSVGAMFMDLTMVILGGCSPIKPKTILI